MKTLKDHTICYDGVCPMCNVYTRAFVQTGMLDRAGRETYQCLPKELRQRIDLQRAVNEIALVNRSTGEVYYGIDSLFHVIGHSFPPLQFLFRWKPFAFMANVLYRFISYNRRIIIPARQDEVAAHRPRLHRPYRLAYLMFTWLMTAFLLHRFSLQLTGLVPVSSYDREFLVCGGQLAVQFFVVSFLSPGRAWDYLGNLMTISFAGSLLLLGYLLLVAPFIQHPLLAGACFVFVVTLMFLEHIRRTHLLGLSRMLTVSWVLYRILILTFIL